MKEETYGYGKDIVFLDVGEGNLNLVIITKFAHDTATGNTVVITEAQVHGEIMATTLGSGTYKECYDLCVAKKLELEPKVYNWKNCAKGGGFFINSISEVRSCGIKSDDQGDRNCYPTKADAESALAYCQLLHVVNAINKDYPKSEDVGRDVCYGVLYNTTKNEFESVFRLGRILRSDLYLNTEKGVEVLIRDNEELLKTYFKIK